MVARPPGLLGLDLDAIGLEVPIQYLVVAVYLPALEADIGPWDQYAVGVGVGLLMLDEEEKRRHKKGEATDEDSYVVVDDPA